MTNNTNHQGEQKRRHFSDPEPQRNQQDQSGGARQQQGGFPHEDGGWGRQPEEEVGAGRPARDAVPERDLNIDDDEMDRDPGKGLGKGGL